MVRLFLLLLLVSPLVFTEEAAEEGPAPDEEFYVTAEQVKQFRENGETFFVGFSTRQCPHCKNLGAQIPEILKQFEELQLAAKFYKMDLRNEENKEFSAEHEISGVPTIYAYIAGEEKPIKYEEERGPKEIANWLKKILELSVPFVDSVAQLEELKSKSSVLLLVALENVENEEEVKSLTKLARSHLKLDIAYTTKSVAAEASLLGMYNVLRSDGHTSLSSVEAADKSAKKLDSWIKMAGLPSVVSFPEQASDLFATGITSIVFYMDSAEALEKAEWLRSVAESVRGRFIVASVDTENEAAQNVLNYFGVTEAEQKPFVRLFDVEKSKQYRLESEITEKSLSAWLEAFEAGELKPHMKSEDVPEDWNSAPVKVLVGKNFQQAVMDSPDFVVVEYYAPWCGHCKKLAPEWETLAENLSELSNVVVAKLDATANDFEDGAGDVSGFPTIRLYKAGKYLEDYSGERDAASLEKWVRAAVQGSSDDSESATEEVHEEL